MVHDRDHRQDHRANGMQRLPKEVPRLSRRWAARRFTNIVHWGEPERGGHFGAWEQPELFVQEVRATMQAISGHPRSPSARRAERGTGTACPG